MHVRVLGRDNNFGNRDLANSEKVRCIECPYFMSAATIRPTDRKLVTCRFMDESPRWLIVRGKQRQALKVLQKAASWNKVTLPPQDNLLTLMDNVKQQVGTSVSFVYFNKDEKLS